MDIRQKIIGLLNKIDSETLLKRIYEFIKYIYIYYALLCICLSSFDFCIPESLSLLLPPL